MHWTTAKESLLRKKSPKICAKKDFKHLPPSAASFFTTNNVLN